MPASYNLTKRIAELMASDSTHLGSASLWLGMYVNNPALGPNNVFGDFSFSAVAGMIPIAANSETTYSRDPSTGDWLLNLNSIDTPPFVFQLAGDQSAPLSFNGYMCWLGSATAGTYQFAEAFAQPQTVQLALDTIVLEPELRVNRAALV